MAVILTDNGLVKETIIKFDEDISEKQVGTLSYMFNNKLKGEPISKIDRPLEKYLVDEMKYSVNLIKPIIEQMKKVGMEALVVIGGDGSYNGALKLTEMGINCIGIPGTIDNDIPDTDHTIGFDTALNTIVDALDKLRDTSSSHQRCTILEVMGRRCGDLAINAGIADGAEMVITSEIGYDENKVIEVLKASKASDKKHAIVVITEHITDVHELAKKVEAATGFETRANVLGHMQRGGRPSARDRVLASRMGVYAVELLEAGKGGLCVSEVNGEIKGLPITEVLGHKRETDFSIYEDAIKLR